MSLPNEPCLEADGILLSYRHTNVLSNVYLKCRPGETLGLLGRNGCGKSSLLKIIFGVLAGECQSVRVDGRYVYPAYRRYRGIKLLPQEPFLPENLRVKAAYRLFTGSGSPPGDDLPEIRQRWAARIGDLSGGEKRILETLLLLFSDARYLLLDEPFTHLSPVQIERLLHLLRTHGSGKGIILSDHQYRYVLSVCHRLVLLDQGRTVALNDPQELVDRGYLNAL
jgi:ABC-type multidrug transport system ATPase subunit